MWASFPQLQEALDVINAWGFKYKTVAFTWVVADPPYHEDASKKYYKRPLLKKSQMIREMTRICKVNGFIALLDQYSPNSFPRCLKRIALVGVTSVPNTDMRIFTVWRKVSKFGTTIPKKKIQNYLR